MMKAPVRKIGLKVCFFATLCAGISFTIGWVFAITYPNKPWPFAAGLVCALVGAVGMFFTRE